MAFNFAKIENKELGVSKIIPVLFSDNLLSGKKRQLCDLYLACIRETLKNLYKEKFEYVIAETKNSKNKKKSDIIKKNNIILRTRSLVDQILAGKSRIMDIYDFILESILIINNRVTVRDAYVIRVIYSYECLYKTSGFKEPLFLDLSLLLKKRFSKQTQGKIMVNMPSLYHSCNLINLWENNDSPNAFDHQVEFIRMLNDENVEGSKTVIVNASPIGSGKSVLQTYTCLNSYYRNLGKIRNREIVLITCKNRYVLEEIARGCNVENKIGYWFYYDKKIVPSYFCNPVRNNGRPVSLNKFDIVEIEKQYEYFIDAYIKISNTTNKFQRNLSLPDVIFCNSCDCVDLVSSSFAEKYIKTIVIDEFLIPGFREELRNILSFEFFERIILLSASAPHSIDGFKKLDIYNSLRAYHIKYQYEEIIPSFVRCYYYEEGGTVSWLPTNEITSLKDIKDFNWYHWRFFSPFVLKELMANIEFPGFEDFILKDVGFYSVMEMLEIIKENMLRLSMAEDELYLDRVRAFRSSEKFVSRKRDTWMIVCEDPFEKLCDFDEGQENKKLDIDVEKLLIDFEEKKKAISLKNLDLMKRLESHKKSKNADRLELLEEVSDIEREIELISKFDDVIFKNDIVSITSESMRKLFGELLESLGGERANRLINEMFKGNIIAMDSSPEYYKITNSKNFCLQRLYVSPIMCFGTDMNIYGVDIIDPVDSVTLVQAFGRAGRNRKHIEVPVIAPLESLRNLMVFGKD